MIGRLAIGGVAVAVVLAGLVAATWRLSGDAQEAPPAQLLTGQGPNRGSEPPARIVLPDFTLRSYDGRVVRAEDLRRGITLLTFLDAQCKEACPIIAAVVSQTLRSLPPTDRRRLRAVAITTDPAEDTPAAVRAFLRRQHALGLLEYLVGSDFELRPLWRRFQILPSEETGQDSVHSAPVRIYVDGVWEATQHAGADLSQRNLSHDLRIALRHADAAR
jgi:cytochrome oxidase Cu insertion factor (SCO1/SenC/PrrC family)